MFWPASGIAAGILIAFGRRILPAIVIGVVAGTVVTGLTSDRNLVISLVTSLLNGVWNAGEAVLAAWLLEWWFGKCFTFSSLGRVAGFLTAAALATAASAILGAATMMLLRSNIVAPYWDVWRAWFLSGWVGLVVVAPLVIGLAQVWRTASPRREWVEGVGVLGLTTLACVYTTMNHTTGSWVSFSPSAFLLPLLLWLTARCQPAFAIAGAFLASSAIIIATTFGVGRFGDAAVPITERIKGAQAAITLVTVYTLILLALFAQRKKAEEGLRDSEKQLAKKSAALAGLHEVGSKLWRTRDLRQALDEILAGAISLLSADKGAIRVLDTTRDVLKIAAHRGFKQEFLDFFSEVTTADDSACGRALRSGERTVIEDVEADTLYAPFRLAARTAGYRAVQSTPIKSREGTLLGTLATYFCSVHRPSEQNLRLLDLYVRQAADIIERHKAEDALREGEERLRLAQLRTGVGVWDWNLRTGKMTWTPELETLFGLEPGTVKSYANFRDRVHPDDIAAIEANRETAIRRRATFRNEFRIIRSDGQVRWILSLGGAFYDQETGAPVRILGNNLDITERKLAEQTLAERNAQLSLAGKEGLVGTFAYNTDTENMQISEGYAAIHGFPEGTAEIARSKCLVHPEDVGRVAQFRSDAFNKGSREYSVEYRIFRPGGKLRWVETRCFITYDADGRPKRVVGVSIDVTERKQAEHALAERNLQLALAGKSGRVGSYAYDVNTKMLQFSEGYAAIYDLPEGTCELTGSERRALVHPEDLELLDRVRSQAFEQRRREFSLEYRNILPKRGVRWIESRSLIFYDGDGHPQRIVGVNIDITERKRAEERQRALVAELDHRVKNTLATVSAVVSQTGVGKRSVRDFEAALEGRLRSMAATHELLSARWWRGVSLTDLVRRELAPYAEGNNTEVSGPEVMLRAEAGPAMAMVLHELATNAAKYGALTTKKGRVLIRWDRRLNGHPPRLVLEWQEIGGPPVIAPGNPSYGTSTIRDLIPYEFGGTADLVFAPKGVQCRLELPGDWLSNAADPVIQDHCGPSGPASIDQRRGASPRR